MPKNHYSHITSLQLAKICRVSQGTVDRALNNRAGINPATKQRILDAAKTYGYVPNRSDAPIDGPRSMLYGIVLLNLHNDYFSRLIMDFEGLCKEIGYNSAVMFSHNDLQTEIGCINQLAHLGVDGIILCSVGSGAEYCAYLQSLKLPVVAVGNRLEGIPFVGIDDRRAMTDLTAFAAARGYEELIYYAPVLKKRTSENIYAQEERYRGFLEEVERRGLAHRLITEHEDLSAALPRHHRCAVLCPSDVYAIRVYHTLQACGRGDVGVSGFDNSNLLDTAHLRIDSVDEDREALIRSIYDVLSGRSDEPVTYISHRIVTRGSLAEAAEIVIS